MVRPMMKLGMSAFVLAMLVSGPNLALAHDTKKTEAGAHAGHAHGDEQVYKGYFNDADIKARPFSDYAGEWQSVYPYLVDGTLDPVLEDRAKERGDKTAAEYKAYYDTGYKTDVTRIEIKGDKVDFYRGKDVTSATYADDGFEVLTYKKGNRGVRFIFKKVSGDASAPATIQFSDHRIAPSKSDHFHIYWGDDRQALLKQLENWPTYYPAKLTGAEIVEELLAH